MFGEFGGGLLACCFETKGWCQIGGLFLFLPFVFSLVVGSHGGLLLGGSFGFEDWRRLPIRVVCVVFRER